MDRAPVAVRAPSGVQTGPHRVVTEDGRLRVFDVRGALVLDVAGDVRQESSTQAWITTPDGEYHVKDLCACSSIFRRWKREWREAVSA